MSYIILDYTTNSNHFKIIRKLNIIELKIIKNPNSTIFSANTVPFTKRKKTEGLGPLTIHGKELKMLDKFKYLGVMLDSKLDWNQPLQKIIRKTQTTFALGAHVVRMGP
jgi:hypothetical protein